LWIFYFSFILLSKICICPYAENIQAVESILLPRTTTIHNQQFMCRYTDYLEACSRYMDYKFVIVPTYNAIDSFVSINFAAVYGYVWYHDGYVRIMVIYCEITVMLPYPTSYYVIVASALWILCSVATRFCWDGRHELSYLWVNWCSNMFAPNLRINNKRVWASKYQWRVIFAFSLKHSLEWILILVLNFILFIFYSIT
jgi:hypothetical protein